jgi:hypothetical protein
VPTLRVLISDKQVYEGTSDAIPRVGDRIRHGDQTLRVESAVWDLPIAGTSDLIVTIEVEDKSYGY